MNTPRRTIRVGDLWEEALAVAAERGEKLPEVIREGLREYVDQHNERQS